MLQRQQCQTVYVLRRETDTHLEKPTGTGKIAAEIEFLSLIEDELLNGQVVSIAVLQDVYVS